MEKRAVNEIVTTVLITLLVISLVAIVFSFIREPVQKTGTSLSGGEACLNLDLQTLSCNKTGYVVYKLSALDTGVKLVGVKVIVKWSNGTSAAVDGAIPQLFTTQTFTLLPGASVESSEASVAGIIQVSGGQNYTCGESAVRATCSNP